MSERIGKSTETPEVAGEHLFEIFQVGRGGLLAFSWPDLFQGYGNGVSPQGFPRTHARSQLPNSVLVKSCWVEGTLLRLLSLCHDPGPSRHHFERNPFLLQPLD